MADSARPRIQFPRSPCPAQNASLRAPPRATFALLAPEIQARSPVPGQVSPSSPHHRAQAPFWPLLAPASVFRRHLPILHPGHRIHAPSTHVDQGAGQSVGPRGMLPTQQRNTTHSYRGRQKVSTGARLRSTVRAGFVRGNRSLPRSLPQRGAAAARPTFPPGRAVPGRMSTSKQMPSSVKALYFFSNTCSYHPRHTLRGTN